MDWCWLQIVMIYHAHHTIICHNVSQYTAPCTCRHIKLCNDGDNIWFSSYRESKLNFHVYVTTNIHMKADDQIIEIYVSPSTVRPYGSVLWCWITIYWHYPRIKPQFNSNQHMWCPNVHRVNASDIIDVNRVVIDWFRRLVIGCSILGDLCTRAWKLWTRKTGSYIPEVITFQPMLDGLPVAVRLV